MSDDRAPQDPSEVMSSLIKNSAWCPEAEGYLVRQREDFKASADGQIHKECLRWSTHKHWSRKHFGRYEFEINIASMMNDGTRHCDKLRDVDASIRMGKAAVPVLFAKVFRWMSATGERKLGLINYKEASNKKRCQYCLDSAGHILYSQALKGQSGRNRVDPSLQDNVGFFMDGWILVIT